MLEFNVPKDRLLGTPAIATQPIGSRQFHIDEPASNWIHLHYDPAVHASWSCAFMTITTVELLLSLL